MERQLRRLGDRQPLCDTGSIRYDMEQIERTGSTDLSNAELLILDNVAMLGGIRSMYYNDIFPYQFNYPEHGLDDESLVATLDRFEHDGIITGESITNRSGNVDRTILVTEVGGALWESERKPDWSRYVTEHYGSSRPNSERHRVTIIATRVREGLPDSTIVQPAAVGEDMKIVN